MDGVTVVMDLFTLRILWIICTSCTWIELGFPELFSSKRTRKITSNSYEMFEERYRDAREKKYGSKRKCRQTYNYAHLIFKCSFAFWYEFKYLSMFDFFLIGPHILSPYNSSLNVFISSEATLLLKMSVRQSDSFRGKRYFFGPYLRYSSD